MMEYYFLDLKSNKIFDPDEIVDPKGGVIREFYAIKLNIYSDIANSPNENDEEKVLFFHLPGLKRFYRKIGEFIKEIEEGGTDENTN